MSEKQVIGNATLYCGDCRDVLQTLPENSVDSVVTDPPYGLTSQRPGGRTEATKGRVTGGFMGLEWDHGVPGEPFWRDVIRALKPGGHLLAFGGARTYHRLAVAIEDAGFEIRDCIMWLYGSGFPKSRNVGREAEGWDGWGTALKPAHEPIVVARKPLVGTVAANVQEHGTGALNIDGCRIAAPEGSVVKMAHRETGAKRGYDGGIKGGGRVEPQELGRWPANVIHDGSDDVIEAFPDAPGQQGALTGDEPSGVMGHANTYGRMDRRHASTPRIDQGSAARFFYCAKASRQDRNEGCESLDERPLNWSSGTQSPGTFQSEGTKKAARNNHPTVKPTDLMRYLCRLVTPPDGVVLDPFMGSGSTGKAAILEGFWFVGIELSDGYAEIARSRIEWARKNYGIQLGLAV